MTVIVDKWMETPDVLAFMVEDDDPLMGNIVALGSPDAGAYDVWVQRTNPRSGLTEWCTPIGPTKMALRFSDQVPVNFCDQVNLRNVANYTIDNGRSITTVYYRDETKCQYIVRVGAAQTLNSSMRRTYYLQLDDTLTQDVTYTIGNSTAGLTAFTLTFNDKVTRAGGIKVSFAGYRPGDRFKKGYLCSRLPGAANRGVVDFAGSYGISTFHLIDDDGFSWFDGMIILRRAWNELESPSDGYTTGLDIVDIATSWAIQTITKGNPTQVRCDGHGFANGDKARLLAVSGMTQIDGIGVTPLYTALTVTVVDANNVTLNINSTTFTDLSVGTYDTTLTGFAENRIYKCFNTNRAGTNVWEFDFSAFSKTGDYRIYVPSYGVSDPITFDEMRWAVAGAKHHEGTYNQRQGIALTESAPVYERGIALMDGVNGCTNYWSDLPSICASETSLRVSNGSTTGATIPSGLGAFAPDNNVPSQGLGWVTATRFTGRPGHQDAGDDDDMGVDHLAYFGEIARIFLELQPASRFLPFETQLSSQVLDPVLFAGTDDLPPLFHEMAWYFEAFRTQQGTAPQALGTGAVFGGCGLGHFSAQIPNYPEPSSYYRGTDAGGSLAGQIVMAFAYAPDAITNMVAAYCFAKFAAVAYDYNLTTLGDTYKQAAIDAYNWSEAIYASAAVADAYYNTELGLPARIGWTATTQNAWYNLHNARILVQKRYACSALFRLLGPVDGATYGQFITDNYTAAVSSVAAGGSGYAVNDIITLTNGAQLTVSTLSGSAVATVAIRHVGQSTGAPTNPVAQASTTGSGSGATFNLTTAANWSAIPGTIGAWDYLKAAGADSTAVTYLLAHAFDGLSSTTDFYLSSTTTFNAMIQPGNTSGGTKLNNAPQMILAHQTKVLQNGIDAERGSVYNKSLQAGVAFSMGANMPGKSFTMDFGPRSVTNVLHEDSFAQGYLGGMVPGQTIYGYFAWAAYLGFAALSLQDTVSNYSAEYSTGDFEAAPNFGSKKKVSPSRYGSSYWEWSPENRGMVFPDEFDLSCSTGLLQAALYLHGWDGNTGVTKRSALRLRLHA